MELIEVLRSKVGHGIRIPPVQLMTENGKSEVQKYLEVCDYLAKSNENDDPDAIMRAMFDYRMSVRFAIEATGDELANKRGKWTTRFRKELKSRGITLTDQQLGRIGDIVMQTTDQEGPWFVDFADRFDWEPGSFGDEGSCYWTCRTNARDMMEFHKCVAIRTYRSDSFCSGTGRAWIAKPEVTNLDYVVIFNAYGKRLDKMTRILSRALEMDNLNVITRHIALDNDEGNFWVNSNEAFALSEDKKVENLDNVALGYHDVHGRYFWKANIDAYSDPHCEYCGSEIVPTTEHPYVENMRVRGMHHSGGRTSLICASCASVKDIAYCDSCHCYHDSDNMLKDLRGHSICISGAIWLGLCKCGRIQVYGEHDFAGRALTIDNLSGGCWECTRHGRHADYLFGPLCRECFDKISNQFIFAHSHDFNSRISFLSEYGALQFYDEREDG